MRDPNRDAFRKEVYVRLERDDPRRWEGLQGCTVKHCVFGEGTISKVLMPDWSNPVHLAVRFGTQERMFHLASFGDGTKFPVKAVPHPLAEALANAELEIAREEKRLQDDLQRREGEAREAAQRRDELKANRLEAQRLAEATQEAARLDLAEARLGAICDNIDHDQPLPADEIRLLLDSRQHELLLRYYVRSYARTNDYRPLVKAATSWREAKQPQYALKVSDMLMESIDRIPAKSRAVVFTARAGAYLDLHQLVEAREYALKAIEADGKSPHPCHLLGVILMASGDAVEGAQYFAKARQLAGTPSAGRFEKAQQAEVKKQLQAVDSEKQRAFAQDLLRSDPQRYNWVETYLR